MIFQRSIDIYSLSGPSFPKTTTVFGVLNRRNLLSYLQEIACPSIISSSNSYGTCSEFLCEKLRGMLKRKTSIREYTSFDNVCRIPSEFFNIGVEYSTWSKIAGQVLLKP